MKGLIKATIISLVAFGFGCGEKSTAVPISEALRIKITNPRWGHTYPVRQTIDIQTESYPFDGYQIYGSGWGVGIVGDSVVLAHDNIGSYPYVWSFYPTKPGNYWVGINVSYFGGDYWDRVIFTVE